MSLSQKQQLSDNSLGSIDQISMTKLLHQQYFQNLQHKLIFNSNKLSNYIGTSYPHKIFKANSFNLNQQTQQTQLHEFNKYHQCSSVSPSKKRVRQLNKIHKQRIQTKNDKKFQIKSAQMAYFKLQQIKQNFDEIKIQNQIQLNQQRNIAYNYDFISPEIQKQKQINHKEVQQKNSLSLLKTVYDQKQKMSQTISTTSSFSNKKLNSNLDIKKSLTTSVKLTDFQIIKPLGEGKFGVVYLARHIKTNFVCALKKIPQRIQDQCILEQLIRQIKIHAFLDHPNIAQLYTFFMQHQHIYLVMELCYSGNVYTILRKEGRFQQQKVRSIIKQICYALEDLHQHNIIHRDIKPQNILFHQNVVKLCDFGWSVYAPLSRGTLCGTPIYASPELVMKKQYNSKIDVWNIGILTYELLYGRVPFEIRCSEDLYKVIEEQIYFPKSIKVSEIAKDFIRQCLNKNPEFRVSIVKLLDHQFIYQKECKKINKK